MSDKEKAARAAQQQTAAAVLPMGANRAVQEDNISDDIKQNGGVKSNAHNRDVSSKTVFGNPVLCAQFLRDNFEIPVLKNIQPEDIEDISERYQPYLGTEFDSDTVKKIRILGIGKACRVESRENENNEESGEQSEEPAFLVSLIEHKSLVDYDVSMQLLRYMMCIWTEYRREMEAKREGCTRRKSFRYPMIIPIVYYEGKENWTADRNLRGRIRENPGLGDWIPDFRYEVVRVHDYSNRELLDRGDEMSLVMLINKIQDTVDLEKFIRIPADEIDRIIESSPGHVIDILVSVMESLCFKIDASEEERTQCVRKVRARKMGYLFENMEKISIQEERRKTEEQKKLTEEERRKTEEQKKLTEEQKKLAEEQKKLTEEQKKLTEEQKKLAEEQKKLTEEERVRADNAEEKLKMAEETIKRLKEKYNIQE